MSDLLVLTSLLKSKITTPGKIPGGNLKLWLDAADTSTITELGGSVSQWDDKSGNGNNAVQSIGAAQPATGSDTLNGKNVLTFATDFMEADGVASVLNGTDLPYTIFAVTTASISGDRYLWSWGDSVNSDFHYARYDNPGYRISKQDGAASSTSPAYGSQVNDTYDINSFSNTGIAITAKYQGLIGLDAFSMDVGAMDVGWFTIGALRWSNPTTGALTGNIAEFIVYDRALSDSEVNSIEGYLSSKWALPIAAPTNVPDLQLWLDASDVSTITESGGLVSQWNDKSGNGNNATQGTGANQPTTGDTSQNGLNTLSFDGGDFLTASAIASIMDGSDKPASIFAVTTSQGTGSRVIWCFADSVDSNFNFVRYNTGSFAFSKFDGTVSKLEATTGTQVNGTYDLTALVNAGITADFRDDGAITSDDFDFDVGTMTCDTFAIGSLVQSGSPTAFLIGSIAELIVYDRELTLAETNQVETYLANKWGITIA